ncbi:MAG: diaminopimelate epimerase [Alistipes sp.]
MQIEFTKYEGAGNDFILIDARITPWVAESALIAKICDRHFGIGADGVMVLRAGNDLAFSMRYYNADGSEGEMCGNGGRCFALFCEHLGLGGSTKHFNAPDGAHAARLLHIDGHAGEVELSMTGVERIETGDHSYFLNTGVPHYVEFVEDVAQVDVVTRGRAIRHNKRFPAGTNVNFVQITGDGLLKVRTYERGVENETLACGTGATAAAIATNFATQPRTTNFTVTMPGGVLHIAFDHRQGTQSYTNIRLSGAAHRIFKGIFNTDNF